MSRQLCVILLIAIGLAGCSAAPVKAWQKAALAQPGMSLEQDPLQRRFAAHVYTSKEAASGGQGVGGGGCGCN